MEDLDLREQAVKILYKQFGQHDSIYTCADEWSKKFETTSGIVSYYKTYYANSI